MKTQQVEVKVHATRVGFGAEILRGGKRIALSPPFCKTEAAARVWADQFLGSKWAPK